MVSASREFSQVRKVVEGVEKKECLHYSFAFSGAAAKARQEDKSELGDTFNLLARITGIGPRPENSTAPYSQEEILGSLAACRTFKVTGKRDN